MMSEVLNLGVIGCGGMTNAHLKAMQMLWDADFRDFRVVACCDLVEEAASNFAASTEEIQGFRPAVYTDYEKLLQTQPDIAAVDVSVLHREHHPIAVAVLEAGKHLFIEKPLGITMRAARLILDAAEKSGRVLQVAENYRRDPGNRAARWALQEGRIGEIWMVYWIDLFERLWHWGWRESVLDAGGGWMLDGGVHTADLLRFLAGPVREVYGYSRAYYPFRHGAHGHQDLSLPAVPVDVEDTTMALLDYESGATGTWLLTEVGALHDQRTHLLYGSEGCLQVGDSLKRRDSEISMEELTKQYMASLDDEDKERWFPHGVTNSVATEIAEFVRACLYGGPVETDGHEGYRAMALCYALYESQATGQPVAVSDIEELKIEAYQSRINEALGI